MGHVHAEREEETRRPSRLPNCHQWLWQPRHRDQNRAAQRFHPLTWTRRALMLHLLAGELQAPRDPTSRPHICTSIQQGNNPDLVWCTGSSCKNSFPGSWGRGKLPSSPAPLSTPSKDTCSGSLPSTPLVLLLEGGFLAEPKLQHAGSKFPHFLGAGAAMPARLHVPCSDGVCFSVNRAAALLAALTARRCAC